MEEEIIGSAEVVETSGTAEEVMTGYEVREVTVERAGQLVTEAAQLVMVTFSVM